MELLACMMVCTAAGTMGQLVLTCMNEGTLQWLRGGGSILPCPPASLIAETRSPLPRSEAPLLIMSVGMKCIQDALLQAQEPCGTGKLKLAQFSS